MDTADKVALVFGALMALILAWTICAAVFSARVDAHCKGLGWREGKVTFNFAGYCMNRDEQTDITVPWREAKRK